MSVDVYRTPARRFLPACMHCMTARWIAFNAMWCFYVCQVCGEEYEPPLPKREAASKEAWEWIVEDHRRARCCSCGANEEVAKIVAEALDAAYFGGE